MCADDVVLIWTSLPDSNRTPPHGYIESAQILGSPINVGGIEVRKRDSSPLAQGCQNRSISSVKV
jgi:hypothetical protein